MATKQKRKIHVRSAGDSIDNEISIPVMIGRHEYAIECDRYNYIFGRVGIDNKSKKRKVISDISYFGSLESLMRHVQTRKVKNTQARSIEELQRNIIHAKEYVAGLYQDITNTELQDL